MLHQDLGVLLPALLDYHFEERLEKRRGDVVDESAYEIREEQDVIFNEVLVNQILRDFQDLDEERVDQVLLILKQLC